MVFDVDGVLVDTANSYTVAVMRAVDWLLASDAKVTAPPTDRDTVRVWREAGGWNNDWDLATALYRWRLAPPEPAETAARRSLDELGARAGSRAPRTRAEIQMIFEELYNGSRVAAARYGLLPRLHIERGLEADETVLLRAETIDALRALGIIKFAVVTGRSADDWAQVADRIPLPRGIEVSTDTHGRKPDPLLLKRVLDNLGSKGFVAVGDTVDDVRMVTSYLPLKGSAEGYAVVRCEPDRESVFRVAGAKVFVRDVNELPSAVLNADGPNSG